MVGTLFVVATPIGNLEDITHRALRVLRDAAVIAAEDTRRTARLLAHYAITTPATSLHEHNEAEKTPKLLARLQQGDSVALVSDAGTPTVSDPGRRLIAAAVAAGIRVEPIPGPSAVVAALSVSGLPSEMFSFLGFPPIKAAVRTAWFERMRQIGGTVVFFEAPHRIRTTLTQLRDAFGDRCNIALCREMTKYHEELVVGPIDAIIDGLREPKGEYTVVVDLGHTIDTASPEAPCDQAVLDLFGRITGTAGLSRRQVIAEVARRLHLRPNEVYAILERAKNSVI